MALPISVIPGTMGTTPTAANPRPLPPIRRGAYTGRSMDAANRAEALARYATDTAGCVRCPLAETRTQVVFGSGNPDAELMLVGEAPGFHEDQGGLPFAGQAGELLGWLLTGIGLDRDDVYLANVLKCRPPQNRDPLESEITACEPHLFRQIELVRPRVVATLGNFATRLLSGRPFGITRVHGQEHALEVGGTSVLLYPLYHPAAALYTPSMLQALEDDFSRLPGLLGRAAPVPAPVRQLPVAQPEHRDAFEDAELAEPLEDTAVAAGATQLGLF
jgi:uracil-DNA glycosylase family 4